jgi:hypothetical protein
LLPAVIPLFKLTINVVINTLYLNVILITLYLIYFYIFYMKRTVKFLVGSFIRYSEWESFVFGTVKVMKDRIPLVGK